MEHMGVGGGEYGAHGSGREGSMEYVGVGKREGSMEHMGVGGREYGVVGVVRGR